MAKAHWIQPIKVDGDFGPYTRECLQRALSILRYYDRAIDGNFGKQSALALQKYMRANKVYPSGRNAYPYALDGIAGQKTWECWGDLLYSWGYKHGGQGWDNQPIPQNIGYGTTRKTQAWLNDFRTDV